MISRKQILELEAAFLIIVAVVVGLIVMSIKNGTYQSPFNIISRASPAPSPVKVIAPKISVYSQISPDGAKMLVMKVAQNPEGNIYDFYVSDGNGTNEKLIFSKTLNLLDNMSIPFNAWSPDDKLFFIQENSGSSKSVLAFRGDGAQISGGTTHFDVTDLFAKANTGNIFDEATGWASETLIIINTKKQDGTKGPSYWFEIPSKAIIQLSTEF